jgi:3-deoxy-D-manno-octulosonic acid kinase
MSWIARFPFHRRRTRVAEAFASARGARLLTEPDGLDRLLAQARPLEGGRSMHHGLAPGLWPVAVRIRPGRRGGWLGHGLGDRFFRPGRVEAELLLTEALRAANLPVVQPVFSAARRSGLFWRTWLASVDHPKARDGLALLESGARQDVLIAAARAAGCALRELHDAGLRHGDLHLRNLLFEASRDDDGALRFDCRVVDLDRSRRGKPLETRIRMREWMRLVRSFEKRGLALSPRIAAAAWGSYCQKDRALRRGLRTHLAGEQRRNAFHRLGWRLTSGAAQRRVQAFRTLLGLFVLALPIACNDIRDPLPPGSREHVRASLLAVGDTGRLRPLPALFEGQRAVAHGMEREHRRAAVDALVLLGDNFYTDGLTRETLVPRVRANVVTPYCFLLALDGPRSNEVESACHVAQADRKPTPVFAVLGNHDLEHPESAQLQREAVADFVPGWRMSASLAQRFRVAPGVDLILFESEPSIDDREAIGEALRTAIRDAPGPWRILATHRPIATDDLGRPRLGGYPEFVRAAIASAGRPVQLVLAAHHHSLQAFAVGAPIPSLQLGLGGGARAEPPLASDDHPDVRFSRRALGFARIDVVRIEGREQLVASLFESPSLPALDPFVQERLVARFAVDPLGRVERLAPMTEGHRLPDSDRVGLEPPPGAQARLDRIE